MRPPDGVRTILHPAVTPILVELFLSRGFFLSSFAHSSSDARHKRLRVPRDKSVKPIWASTANTSKMVYVPMSPILKIVKIRGPCDVDPNILFPVRVGRAPRKRPGCDLFDSPGALPSTHWRQRTHESLPRVNSLTRQSYRGPEIRPSIRRRDALRPHVRP